MINFLIEFVFSFHHLLLDASVYILFGLLVAGLIRVFLNPSVVARHMGTGRFASVFKAAFLGIPVPLWSCGVLPAAVSLRKQGANKGAVTAFLISTPESGVDSIAITYALLDPLLTVMRPVAAFFTAAVAGIAENFTVKAEQVPQIQPDLSCPVDNCCDGINCSPEAHRHHHSFLEKLVSGLRYAFTDFWDDLVGYFIIGLVLAALITVLVPDSFFTTYLHAGMPAMLIMLAAGVPLYVCATASTPIAAALILKGVSPGAALVFLLVGPATNIATLTVLIGTLGKRSTVVYLTSIAACAILFGLIVDSLYQMLGISPIAVLGQASEALPHGLATIGAILLILISIPPLWRMAKNKLNPRAASTSSSPVMIQESMDESMPDFSAKTD